MIFKEQLIDRFLSDIRTPTRIQTIVQIVGEFGNFSFQIIDSFLLLFPIFQHFFRNIQCSQYGHRQWWLLGYFFMNPVQHCVNVRGDSFGKVFILAPKRVIRAEDFDLDALAGHTVRRNYVRKLVRRYVNQIALTVIRVERELLETRINFRNQLFHLGPHLFLLLL